MERWSVEKLKEWVEKREAQLKDPSNSDDPKWLKRRINTVRELISKKEKAQEHKENQKRISQRKVDT